MPDLRLDLLEEYLSNVYKKQVKIGRIVPLSLEALAGSKAFGYRVAHLIECAVCGETKRLVFETMRPEGFGHDYGSDRAAVLLWQHAAFGNLPRHVRSVDVGAFDSDGETLHSVGSCSEFFIITEFVEGEPYRLDLNRIRESGFMSHLDEERCVVLSDYLAEIHSVKKKDAPQLYIRRIRDLLGHGECIFGLTDSYPSGLDYVDEKFFTEFEKSCIEWRWRLKAKTHRLAQVHGDFHPGNIMFTQGVDFAVLGRSRGEWGEPADDVVAMTINYIFYSLITYGRIDGVFERMLLLFWRNYLDRSGDEEILKIVQPFYAWRSLVIASPIWHPKLPSSMRKSILSFAMKVLKSKEFDYENVGSYLK